MKSGRVSLPVFELFQQSLTIIVREKLTDKASPRCDLVKLFIGGACSLQAALHVITGQVSEVVERLQDLFRGYSAKYLSVIVALLI